MLFVVTAKNADGQEFKTTREGVDRFAAARAVKKDGATVISVVPLNESLVRRVITIPFLKHVSLRERIVFAQNLSSMISAGLPLSRALEIFERQTKNEYFKSAVTDIRRTIDKGGTLSEALSAHPLIFSRVFVSMVAAGEESGTLPESLKTVALQLDKSYALRKKVTGALMYPAIILSAMFFVGIFMMIFVVPSLAASFTEVGADLPFTTKMVIAASNFLAAHTGLALFSIFIIIFGVVLAFRTNRGRRMTDYVLLRIPAVSVLVKESNTATLARTLASLVSAGVEVVEAITITSRVVSNSYYAESLMEASLTVQKGLPLSEIFTEHTRLYPVLLGAMTEVGEETGKLAEMLMNTAVFYEEEVDQATKNLSTIIEPVLMIVIGSAVGFFAVSMIQPMYTITQHV